MESDVLRLTSDMEIDVADVESATLSKKGARINPKAVTVSSGAEELTVAQDVLIVRLKDGTELSVRGDEAQSVYSQLQARRQKQGLTFKLNTNAPS
jgi:hypothetical protein